MIGTMRLQNLEKLLHDVIKNGIPGDYIEIGKDDIQTQPSKPS